MKIAWIIFHNERENKVDFKNIYYFVLKLYKIINNEIIDGVCYYITKQYTEFYDK